MKRLRIVVPLSIFCLFLVGWATDRSAKGEPEKVIVQEESSEKYDSLVERLRTSDSDKNLLRDGLNIQKRK